MRTDIERGVEVDAGRVRGDEPTGIGAGDMEGVGLLCLCGTARADGGKAPALSTAAKMYAYNSVRNPTVWQAIAPDHSCEEFSRLSVRMISAAMSSFGKWWRFL
ncbi:MAG: hypothetical protein LBL59_11135 [Xanthomonadaceae bacterium]|nr:hypothetical protein [Xanthomonadaceae bacterium]